MQDESEKWLKVLGLASGATGPAIREAYRDLVKVWHPDRFATDPRLRQKAEEKLADLNAAFAHLQNYRRPDSTAAAASRSSGPSYGWPGRNAGSLSVPPGQATAPTLSTYKRIAAALIVLAATGGGVGWLFFSGRHTADERTGATRPLEPPVEQGAPHVSATPEKKQPHAPSRSESPVLPTTGSLRVQSQPTGARISVDGETIGITPLVISDVTPGEHQIMLNLDGTTYKTRYKMWSSSVIVAAGREEKLLAVLTPASARH
jgi:hypothetical protein